MDDLIAETVDRLLEVDSPSLETIKMQVAFDSGYIAEEENLINFYQRRTTRLREIQRTISTMHPRDGADFDALTALHRQVRCSRLNFIPPSFAYVLNVQSCPSTTPGDHVLHFSV